MPLADAGLSDLVAPLPHGVGTRLGERGSGISAGERQRVALAAPSSATRAYCSSTSPRPTSTARPRRRCSTPSPDWPAGARW